jgi:hypothetical protein
MGLTLRKESRDKEGAPIEWFLSACLGAGPHFKRCYVLFISYLRKEGKSSFLCLLQGKETTPSLPLSMPINPWNY